jgi:hypothetical protein
VLTLRIYGASAGTREYRNSASEEFYRQGMGIFGHFMNFNAVYLHWGWLLISVTNLLVILSMVTIFLLALTLPFPQNKENKK